MERIKMPNTSNGLIKELNGEKCDKHPDAQLFSTPGGVVCVQCAALQRDEEDREYGRKAILSERLKTTWGALERFSIIVDESIREASLKNYDTEHPKHKEVIQEARDIMNAFVKGKRGNVWLVGDAGTGKSHIAMSILKGINEYGRGRVQKAFDDEQDIMQEGYTCVFMTVNEMYRDIRRSFNEKGFERTESYFIELCGNADILVLDDLGAESGSMNVDREASRFVQEILYSIANARQDKMTIITTNLKKDARTKLYDTKMLSRLYKNMKMVVFQDMPDMRRTEEGEEW